MKTQAQEQILNHIRSDAVSKDLNMAHQNRHLVDSGGFIEGRSRLHLTVQEAQEFINQHHGTGEVRFSRAGKWINKEFIIVDTDIGVYVNKLTGEETPTNRVTIHYSKRGAHLVPASPFWKGR